MLTELKTAMPIVAPMVGWVIVAVLVAYTIVSFLRDYLYIHNGDSEDFLDEEVELPEEEFETPTSTSEQSKRLIKTETVNGKECNVLKLPNKEDSLENKRSFLDAYCQCHFDIGCRSCYFVSRQPCKHPDFMTDEQVNEDVEALRTWRDSGHECRKPLEETETDDELS